MGLHVIAPAMLKVVKRRGVRLLEWSAYSPDLHPIENVWGIMVRHVYAGQRQFDSVESLVDAIIEFWDSLSSETLLRLNTVLGCKTDALRCYSAKARR